MKYQNAIIFISGLISGSIVGYFYAKKRFDSELESAMEYYDRISTKEDFENDSNPEKDDPIENDKKEKIQRQRELVKKNDELSREYMARITPYHKAFSNGHGSVDDFPLDEESPTEESELVEDGVEPTQEGDIRFITQDEFGDNADYEQESLTFYSGDNTLVDEYDNPIDNLEEAIGRGDLNGCFDEEDVIFVYNPVQQKYYEIICDPHRYIDTLRG